MTRQPDESLREAVDRVIELEQELEASGTAAIAGSELERHRAALHKWVDDLVGVVVSPGLGRVTVIHPDGRKSSIASATLPYLMCRTPD
jgi:hypothetical protein